MTSSSGKSSKMFDANVLFGSAIIAPISANFNCYLTVMITHYLEMKSESELAAKKTPCDIEIKEAEVKNYKFNKFLYQLVGEPWCWTDKLSLPDEAWQSYAEASNLRTWVAYVRGSIAGYYELQCQSNGDVELAYFGLAQKFIGKGFGGYLLTHAIQSAWAMENTKRIWVHTCSLDHPSALNNYVSRGFSVYNVVSSY
jgi:GNAT superfamily N-acetyltransferase